MVVISLTTQQVLDISNFLKSFLLRVVEEGWLDYLPFFREIDQVLDKCQKAVKSYRNKGIIKKNRNILREKINMELIE